MVKISNGPKPQRAVWGPAEPLIIEDRYRFLKWDERHDYIDLAGLCSDKSALFESPAGSALCYRLWKSMKCFFKFNNINIDSQQVQKVLSANFTGNDFTKKLMVSRAFDGEPVGILQIK